MLELTSAMELEAVPGCCSSCFGSDYVWEARIVVVRTAAAIDYLATTAAIANDCSSQTVYLVKIDYRMASVETASVRSCLDRSRCPLGSFKSRMLSC